MPYLKTQTERHNEFVVELEKKGHRIINRDLINQRPKWINGQISHWDSAFLSGFLQEIKPRNTLEIGVASGWSSVVTLLSLEAALGDGFSVAGCDMSKNFYINESKRTGAAVSEIVPHLMQYYSLHIGDTAFGLDPMVKELDFAFIDANHLHPFATLDLIAVLPRLSLGAWVALHDLHLHLRPKHKHRHRGSWYVFNALPGTKIHSNEEPTMIGAVELAKPAEYYLPYILEILYTPWEAKVAATEITRAIKVIDQSFGAEWAALFEECFSEMNANI